VVLGNIFTTGVACEAGYAYHFGASVITTDLLFLLKVIFGIKICVLKKYSLLFKQIL
jgi:hypothetical protein